MKPIPFNNRYVNLGKDFYARTTPAPVPEPALILFNHGLGDELGLSDTCLNSPEGMAIFAGNRVPDGAAPLAMAYAGHQFGHFRPQLDSATKQHNKRTTKGTDLFDGDEMITC